MLKFLIISLSLLAGADVPRLAAQQAVRPTPAQFRSQASRVVTNEEQWQKAIDAVVVDDLPVPYAIGKSFVQNKEIVTADLKMAVRWAKFVVKDDSGIYDEVNFLSAIQELQNQLQQFASLMNEFDMPDEASRKKVMAWTQGLSDLANGPVEEVYTSSFLFTTGHALQLQKTCSAPAPARAK